ncbi:MAG: hypothetical protein QF893_11080, partial [Alphaproteobacteria bacterium]|nr:hypothetical protein [Alphaproteobacteria bacterium]
LSLARSLSITEYRETMIEWPGFDGPVGVVVEIEVSHDSAPDGLVYAPEIRMGPIIEVPLDDAFATLTSGSGYFKDYHIDQEVGPLALLKAVLFRSRPARNQPPRRLDASGRSRFTFRLFPGTIALLDSPDRLCLDTVSPGLPVCGTGQKAETGCKRPGRRAKVAPIYQDGSDLSALWYFAGSSNMVGDFSPQLAEALRQHSALQGAPERWTAMQKRLEPDGLGRAGYGLCPPGPKSHSAFQICYCR